MRKKTLLFAVISCTFILNISGQLSEDHLKEITEILKPVNSQIKPGVSAAIVREGEIVYSESMGLANLATGAQSNKNTLYQIDALSQQFTSLAFLKLIESEAVSLDDNIHEYLPELPLFKHPILVRHILNHTSGLNNYEVVNMLSGIPASQGFNNEMAMAVVASQKTLSHKPGTVFSFFDSKTESLLMAEIISRASGLSFQDYLRQNVFLPLGLNDAVFITDTNLPNPNKAIAYEEIEGVQAPINNSDNIVGPSNLYISIADISKWYSFFSLKSADKANEIVKKLDTPVTNDNGDVYVSGWGEMTIGRSYLHLERGLPKYWQYGLKGGYGANIFRFPDLDLISIVIGNNNSYNGMYAMSIVSSITEPHFTRPATVEMNSIPVVSINQENLSTWAGEYLNPLTGQTRKFEVQKDTLRYVRGPNRVMTLLPIDKSSFQAVMQSDDVLKFHFEEKDGQRYYDVASFEGDDQRYFAFDSNYNNSEEDLKKYSGLYVNTELGHILSFSQKNNQLIAAHSRLGEITFRNIKEDLFVSESYALSSIEFHRSEGIISHFSIRTGGINSLTFQKTYLTPYIEKDDSYSKSYQQ